MEWGLRAPITPRLGGNCWALPRLGKIGAEQRKNKPTLNTKLRILPSTHVAKSDSLMELALSALYSESAVKSGIATDTADLIFASVPYKILPTFQIPVYKQIAERDAEFYDRLTKAGFLLDLWRRRLRAFYEVFAPGIWILH